MGLTFCPSCIQGHTTKTHTPEQGHSRRPCGSRGHPDPPSPPWPLLGGRELCSLLWRDRPGGQGPRAVQPRVLIKLTRLQHSFGPESGGQRGKAWQQGRALALAATAGFQDVTSRHVCGDTDKLGRKGTRAPSVCRSLPSPVPGALPGLGWGNPASRGSRGPVGKRSTDVGTRRPPHTPGGWFSLQKPSSSALTHTVGEDLRPAL